MANITMDQIKKLREWSGAGIMDCKAALSETDGDMDKAMEALRKKRADIAASKAHRATKNGIVGSYLHVRADGGVPSLGVLVEVLCETDFAARAKPFKDFVNNLCLHIAMANPQWLTKADVPAAVIEKEKCLYKEQLKETGKPEAILDKIAEGKLTKFFAESCLLEQQYALAADKSEQKAIAEMVKDTIGQIGENITIRRFVRFDLGSE